MTYCPCCCIHKSNEQFPDWHDKGGICESCKRMLSNGYRPDHWYGVRK